MLTLLSTFFPFLLSDWSLTCTLHHRFPLSLSSCIDFQWKHCWYHNTLWLYIVPELWRYRARSCSRSKLERHRIDFDVQRSTFSSLTTSVKVLWNLWVRGYILSSISRFYKSAKWPGKEFIKRRAFKFLEEQSGTFSINSIFYNVSFHGW